MQSFEMLEYTTILGQLADLTHTSAARLRVQALAPTKDTNLIAKRSMLIGQAAAMLDASSPPLTSLDGTQEALPLLALGDILSARHLVALASFLSSCRRMQLYLARMKEVSHDLSSWQYSLDSLTDIVDEVERCIRGEQVDDRASSTLRAIRRQIEMNEDNMRGKLDSLLRAHPDWFMESYVTQRGGRLVLPLKKEYRKNVAGAVVDASASGSTLFIEPNSVGSMRDDLALLRIKEQNEVQRILAELSQLFADQQSVLKQNRQCLEELDFYFACAQMARQQKAIPVRVEDNRVIHLVGARHPLLPPKACVPLDFFLGRAPADVGVVITGPNTGGKTVALKTVGLLCLMAQTGLHVPCKEGVFPILDQVLCDLGDGQSISQNLSTFSAHVTRWVDILEKCTPDTLVLCDELGSGTDPQEGMGLATAMLEGLANRGALILATTHYPEIKTFASQTFGFINASMAFDPQTLSPLYRLELGKAGRSCALLIARRLGLADDVLTRAAQVCGGELPSATPVQPEKEAAVVMPDAPQAPAPVQSAIPKPQARPYEVGESVYVHQLRRTGIVAAPANAKGEVVVKVANRQYTVNQKRLSPHLSRQELYPDAENYDLDIVLDTVANRKAKHKMSKGHSKDNVVTVDNNAPKKL